MAHVLILLVALGTAHAVTVTNLKTEYLENPLGIDKLTPRFQWEVMGDGERGLTQVSYRIKIGNTMADGSVWDSQDVPSSQTSQIKYNGPSLKSSTMYYWSVSVVTSDVHSTTASTPVTSDPAFFSMGVLAKFDWAESAFIGANFPKPTCPWFRKTFKLPAGATANNKALLHLASVGYQELYVNGQQVDTEAVLIPSVSYLPKRVLYRTYDVTSLLNDGATNVIGVWASAGWGAYMDLDHGIATSAPLILVQMTIGTSFSLVSDATWKVTASNIVSTGGGPGGGDSLDDSKANPNWNTVGLDDSSWTQATAHAISIFPNVTISADSIEPTRRHSSIPAAKVVSIDAGYAAIEQEQEPESEWWGPASLSDKPAQATNNPFCGSCGLDPNVPTTSKYEELKLACPSDGDTIESIDFAVWGVPTGGPSCSSWKAGDPCGNVNETMAWAQSLCVGKPACVLNPIDKNGHWDPCPGKKKTLAVVATCKMGHGKATVINTGPTPPPSGPPPAGTWLVTMNELYTGWFEVHNMKGEPNSTVHFQVSTTAGKPLEFGMQDSYTFGPSGTGSFRMRFAYHEIHYITITGLKNQPLPSDVIGYRLTSLGNRTGDFSCSNSLISQMYTITINNYRGLTTGGMTVDCPHRERRGYGGDGHTSYQFALANYPVGAYFNKWTRDFADVQGVAGKNAHTPAGTGLVPNTAPTVGGGGGPAWGGFSITNPWQTYNTFNDTDILEDMYPTMVALLAFYANNTKADGLLHPWDASQWDFLGDWITPHGSESDVNSPRNLLFNNCYLHYITALVSKISTILGNTEAAAKYAADASQLAAAVNKAYGNSTSGVYVDMLQTHAVMPLASGLVPDDVANKTWRNLANQIQVVDTGHLDTGLTGTYFMTKLLMESGRNDLIFTYANKTDFPSYGYFIQLGYTTWPEQWDVQVGDSLLHGCYNAIGVWFVEGVAGIRVHASESPPITVRAGVDAGDITSAQGKRVAFHGEASSAWRLVESEGKFMHNITIPTGGVAKVMVPSSDVAGVTEGGRPVSGAPGITVIGMEVINKINYVSLNVVAGMYTFESMWKRSTE